jgi:hypothetical protein
MVRQFLTLWHAQFLNFKSHQREENSFSSFSIWFKTKVFFEKKIVVAKEEGKNVETLHTPL